MAFQDLLDGITVDANQRIAAAKAEHQQRMSELRTTQDRDLQRRLHSITQQKEQRKVQLRDRAQSQAAMLSRMEILRVKQELLDDLYTSVLQALVDQPAKDAEAFLKHCLEQLPGTGTIRPTKAHAAYLEKHLPKGCQLGETIPGKGGFRFSSDKAEQDWTYEFLVEQILRPQTDIQVSESLFHHAA